MKLAIISDTHLGCRQYGLDVREKDFFDAFAYALKKAVENGCEAVLHCGDLFDVQRPHNRVIAGAYRLVEEAGLPLIVIPGNHDYAWRGDIPPGVLLDMEGHNVNSPARVLCADGYIEHYDLDGVRIVGIRYLTPSEIRREWERLKKEAESLIKPDWLNVLLLHQEWRRVSPQPEIGAFDFGDLPEGFDFVFFGHVHSPAVEENCGKTVVVNVGSTENTSYREAKEPKYVWILNTGNGRLDRVYIPTRPVVFVKGEGDIEVVAAQQGRVPIVVLENPELEADVLQVPHLKVIRRWEERRTGVQDALDGSAGRDSFLEELLRGLGSDPASRVIAEAVEIALFRADLSKEDVLNAIEELVEKALREEVDAAEGAEA